MSTFTPNFTLAVVVEAIVSAYRFVKLGTADKTVIPATAGTEKIIGVSTDECGDAIGNALTIQTLGTAKIEAGGTISSGDYITSGAGGVAIATTTAGNTVRGIAVQDAVAGDIFEIQLVHFIHA